MSTGMPLSPQRGEGRSHLRRPLKSLPVTWLVKPKAVLFLAASLLCFID